MNLALSLFALILGPLLYISCQNRVFARSALDGLLFVSIAGLVIVHIVPDVYAIAGLTALAFMVIGVVVAFMVERVPDVGGKDHYRWIVVLGAIGLALHAAMDGVALVPTEDLPDFRGLSAPDPDHIDHDHAGHDHDDHGHSHDHGSGLEGLLSNHLALGVILHRIPVGMAIWSAVRPRMGTAFAAGALAIIAAATSAAYLLGEPVVALMEGSSLACFQAFVAGTLLHVIVFSSANRETDKTLTVDPVAIFGERLGIVAALLILFLVPHAH